MKKTYGLVLIGEFNNSLDDIYIRFYDRDDSKQIPYINATYIKINEYRDKSKFDYKKLLETNGINLPMYFNKIIRNYNFSKKEFKIISKILKAWNDKSYYTFTCRVSNTSIKYTIVGINLNVIMRSNSGDISYTIKFHHLGSLLNFFSLEFKRNKA